MRADLASELKSLRLYGMASAWDDLLGQGESAALQSARWLLEPLLQTEGVNRAMRAGYFHLLDILARPTLMIFGFFLTILLINAVFGFVGTGLKIVFASEMQGTVAGPASALGMIVITMGVIYAVANKSVHLISTVPQTVMRWLGQAMGVDTGGIEVERQSHAYVGGIVGRARNPMAGVGRGKAPADGGGGGGGGGVELSDKSANDIGRAVARHMNGEGGGSTGPGGNSKAIAESSRNTGTPT